MLSTRIAPLLFVSASLFSQTARWSGPDQPVYVVTRNHYAGIFAPDTSGTLVLGELIMIEIFRPPGRRNSEAPYKMGASHALFMGGEHAGQVVVRKAAPLQCNSSAGIVAANAIRFSDNTMALATNARGIQSHPNRQRDPSPHERLQAIRLAMTEFRKHGIPQSLASEVKLERLIATQIDRDGREILSGSLTIKTNKAEHRVFLIVGIVSDNATTELVDYHRTTDLEDGKDSLGLRFVDQLDLDGDGVDEVIVEAIGYENESFLIYKRLSSTWKKVWAGGVGGC